MSLRSVGLLVSLGRGVVSLRSVGLLVSLGQLVPVVAPVSRSVAVRSAVRNRGRPGVPAGGRG